MPLTFPSRQFESFSRKDGISTEHSNLRQWLGVGDWPHSFYIDSEKTGEKKLFRQGEVEKDNEGDLILVKYFHPDDARIPGVTIFND